MFRPLGSRKQVALCYCTFFPQLVVAYMTNASKCDFLSRKILLKAPIVLVFIPLIFINTECFWCPSKLYSFALYNRLITTRLISGD